MELFYMNQPLPNGKRRRRLDEDSLVNPFNKNQLDAEVYREIATLRQENKVLDHKLNAIYSVLNELKGTLEKQEKNFDSINALLKPPPLPKEIPSYYS